MEKPQTNKRKTNFKIGQTKSMAPPAPTPDSQERSVVGDSNFVMTRHIETQTDTLDPIVPVPPQPTKPTTVDDLKHVDPTTGEVFFEHYEWAKHIHPTMSIGDIMRRFREMRYFEAQARMVSVSTSDVSARGIFGTKSLGCVFYSNVLYPIYSPDRCKRLITNIRSLNFSIVGRKGMGKRTYIQQISAKFGISHAIITANTYQLHDITLVRAWARLNMPLVLYIDDFDVLLKNADFVREINDVYCDSDMQIDWNRGPEMITVIALERVNPDVLPITTINNQVIIPEASTSDLEQCFNYLMTMKNISTLPVELPPPMIQRFRDAVRGSTMADITNFVDSIVSLITRSVASTMINSPTRQTGQIVEFDIVDIKTMVPPKIAHERGKIISNPNNTINFMVPWSAVEALYIQHAPSLANQGAPQYKIQQAH